jgi:hypothetical protein
MSDAVLLGNPRHSCRIRFDEGDHLCAVDTPDGVEVLEAKGASTGQSDLRLRMHS